MQRLLMIFTDLHHYGKAVRKLPDCQNIGMHEAVLKTRLKGNLK